MPHNDFDLDGKCLAPGCGNELPYREPRKRKDGKSTDLRSTREQRLTCSDACRKRLQRERAGYRKPFLPCRFCGDLRDDYQGRDVRCPSDDCSEHCDELQFAAENRAAIVAARREERTAICDAPGCEREVTWSGKGRVKTLCSARCRQRARRSALKEAQ
jgi:hypothetical protein